MRSEQEMLDLILETARLDDRIRAVLLHGSRANPNARPDVFRDFDVVYLVRDVAPFKQDRDWIKRFGKTLILQLPDEMSPTAQGDGFKYLMQFMDGNRIDLRLFPVSQLDQLEKDSLSLLLLDKDSTIGTLPFPSEVDYLPKPPTAKQYFDCCNEFWWVAPYVAKGLWRDQIIYARHMLDVVLRSQLLQMLTWHTAIKTQFRLNLGLHGKHLEKHLEAHTRDQLWQTCSGAKPESIWNALETMCDLFQTLATDVARHFDFEYRTDDDRNVSSFIRHIRNLAQDAQRVY